MNPNIRDNVFWIGFFMMWGGAASGAIRIFVEMGLVAVILGLGLFLYIVCWVDSE